MQFFYLGLSLVLTACSSGAFSAKEKSKTTPTSIPIADEPAPSAGFSHTIDNTVIMTSSESEFSSVREVESVTPPTNISGSYLRCGDRVSRSRTILCSIFDSQGKLLTYSPSDAFIYKNGAGWSSASFTKTGNGRYQVSIPNDMTGDFAVKIIFDADQATALADWVGSGLSAANILQDPSFEQFPVTASGWRMLAADEWTWWKAERSSSSRCSRAVVLELQTVAVDTAPSTSYDGNNRLELDSGCQNNDGSDTGEGQNVVAYQELTLNPGQMYVVRFMFAMRNASIPGEGNLRAEFGDTTLIEGLVRDLQWTQFKATVKAGSSQQRLSFEDFGPEDRDGIIIDAVNVIPVPH